MAEPSDWYSIGAMLYEALTGRRPFEGGSEEVMTRKQHEQPVRPACVTDQGGDLPIALVTLCMGLLQLSPAARPTGAEILEVLGAKPSAMTRATSRSISPRTFVGREAELAQLAVALIDARRAGVGILVRGKSGIGKSTLVRKFVRGLGDAVFAIEGRCFEREAVPFKMLDGVVDSLTAVLVGLDRQELTALAPGDLGSLVRGFPVLRRVERFAELARDSPPPVDLQELRRRGLRALTSLLARLARVRPVVIFVDDAHWGDVDSAAVLAELMHGTEPGMLVIVAHRPEDYLGVVAQLRRVPGGQIMHGDLRQIEVPALADSEAGQLVAQLLTDGDRAQTIEAVVAAAAGNPLVLTEMARAHGLDATAPGPGANPGPANSGAASRSWSGHGWRSWLRRSRRCSRCRASRRGRCRSRSPPRPPALSGVTTRRPRCQPSDSPRSTRSTARRSCIPRTTTFATPCWRPSTSRSRRAGTRRSHARSRRCRATSSTRTPWSSTGSRQVIRRTRRTTRSRRRSRPRRHSRSGAPRTSTRSRWRMDRGTRAANAT
ncbi:MAG: AAA family ATPase [Kofleriaceae bacterium]